MAVTASTVKAKHRELLRLRGTPSMVTPEEYARVKARLRGLHGRGMSLQQIVDSAPGGMHATTVGKILNHDRQVTMHRDTYNNLMHAHWVTPPTGVREGAQISPVGALRRLRALAAAGFNSPSLGRELGVSYSAVWKLTNGDSPMHTSTVVRIVALYARLELADPLDYGMDPNRRNRTQNVARRNGWAPPSCWDPDTIDDPDAFPEWTGLCGTRAGYLMHREQQIHVDIKNDGSVWVMCRPCVDARKFGYSATRGNDDVKLLAVELLDAGHSARYIAEATGLCTRTIFRIKKAQPI